MTREDILNVFKEKGIEITIWESPFHEIGRMMIDTTKHDKQIRAEVIDECIKKLAESEDTMLSDRQYYTLIELKEQNE